jgi:predicted methyltransferase
MRKLLTFSSVALSAAFSLTVLAASDSSVDTALHQATAGSWRSDAHKARDQYRHPVETLEFFGLQPDMTVVELAPGGGWYTEILAPALKDHGHLVEATGTTTGKFADMLQANKAQFGAVKLVEFSPPAKTDLGAPGSADMVLTFRNAHNWEGDHQLLAVFQAAFKVLKHGGVLGLTDHRAAAGKTVAETFNSGYMPTDYIIQVAEKAGFKLAGQSEVNANPKDTKDYPKGVWTLPPTYTLGDKDKAKYQTIGESDRMTLKFAKP